MSSPAWDWDQGRMPKRRVTQASERAACTDAAALVVTVIIANGGPWICGKALLLESGEQNAPAGRRTPGRIAGIPEGTPEMGSVRIGDKPGGTPT